MRRTKLGRSGQRALGSLRPLSSGRRVTTGARSSLGGGSGGAQQARAASSSSLLPAVDLTATMPQRTSHALAPASVGVGGLCGLSNLGNTCFMNACLQCLTHTPSLVARLLESGVLDGVATALLPGGSSAGSLLPTAAEPAVGTTTPLPLAVTVATPLKKPAAVSRSKRQGQLARALINVVRHMWNRENDFGALRPDVLKREVGALAPRFIGFQQHDAHEFLRFILDGLHCDLNEIRTKIPYEEVDDSQCATDQERSECWWKNYSDRNKSIIQREFCGQLESKVVCEQCGKTSSCYDPFWDLSVPIPSSSGGGVASASAGLARLSLNPATRASARQRQQRSHSRRQPQSTSGANNGRSSRSGVSLVECLSAFTAGERLEGMEKYFCPNCKTHCCAKKTLRVSRPPQVLVLHVKRFRSVSLLRREKLSTKVRFPTSDLDLRPYCCAHAETALGAAPIYDLVGVTNHMGSMSGGHYTAHCRVQPRGSGAAGRAGQPSSALGPERAQAATGQWHLFNDKRVSQCSDAELNASSAYILFYELQR